MNYQEMKVAITELMVRVKALEDGGLIMGIDKAEQPKKLTQSERMKAYWANKKKG